MTRYFGLGYPMMGLGGGLFMGAVVAIIIGLVVYGLFRLISLHHVHNKSTNDAAQQNTAIKILDERYAKGEIGDEEYKNKKMNQQ